MGLAILPARLKDQSAAIVDILTGSAPTPAAKLAARWLYTLTGSMV